MAKQKFCAGQTVFSKSGGPEMSVLGIPVFDWNPITYVCRWFDGKSYKQALFPEEDLKLATPQEVQRRIISKAPRRSRKVISRRY